MSHSQIEYVDEHNESGRLFVLRGVKYADCGARITKVGGVSDGETWHLAQRADDSSYVWVSETMPGERIQALIPVEMKDAPFVR